MNIDQGNPVRMGVYGTKHSHSAGVTSVMLANQDVEVVGVYEPDRERRRELDASGAAPWSELTLFDDRSEILDDPSIVAIATLLIVVSISLMAVVEFLRWRTERLGRAAGTE